jgi:hypothetical protein
VANTLTCFARLLVRLTLNAVTASDPQSGSFDARGRALRRSLASLNFGTFRVTSRRISCSTPETARCDSSRRGIKDAQNNKRKLENMEGKTGEKCLSTGSYHCKTHTGNHISMEQGKIFPKCNPPPRRPVGHDTTWVKDVTA